MSYSRSPRAVRSMTVGTRGMRAPEPTTVEGVPPALSLRGLTKTYDDGFAALEGFDLDVGTGEFFGLLGPNGAGKTTLISAVCNLIRVTRGEVKIFGHDHDSMEARRLIGLAEQDINLDRFLDVEETLLYHGGYYGMSRADARRRAGEMMDIFDLRAKAGTRAPKLSGGMRRRLLLAPALLPDARRGHAPAGAPPRPPHAGAAAGHPRRADRGRRRRAAPGAVALHAPPARPGH